MSPGWWIIVWTDRLPVAFPSVSWATAGWTFAGRPIPSLPPCPSLPTFGLAQPLCCEAWLPRGTALSALVGSQPNEQQFSLKLASLGGVSGQRGDTTGWGAKTRVPHPLPWPPMQQAKGVSPLLSPGPGGLGKWVSQALCSCPTAWQPPPCPAPAHTPVVSSHPYAWNLIWRNSSGSSDLTCSDTLLSVPGGLSKPLNGA